MVTYNCDHCGAGIEKSSYDLKYFATINDRRLPPLEKSGEMCLNCSEKLNELITEFFKGGESG